MSRYVFKLPDLGEGMVEAEIVAWRVKPGDLVSEDDIVVEVMTEKATVEVPSPTSGRVVSTSGSPGDKVAVGSELIVFETDGAGGAQPQSAQPRSVEPQSTPPQSAQRESTQPQRKGRIATSPANRRRAREAGIDLAQVPGTGPNGRIMRKDLEAYIAGLQRGAAVARGPLEAPAQPRPVEQRARPAVAEETEEIKVIGLRRVIAQRMSESKRNIPHFTYVEEVDVTELEALRQHLSSKLEPGTPALTYLPFLVAALTRVLRDFPQCNAHYDEERGVLVRYRAVHVGIATQTPDGLKVPVVRNAESRSLWDLAAEIRRVSTAARNNKATREELTGSTITVTSLGKLGGIVSTPIINSPEVAIIGVNRAVERPVVHGGAIAIRRIMNLSSSFDHRFVDGYDAASLIQALKERLEHPATIFID